MISVCSQGKPFNITVIQVYAPTSNAEEAEVEQFYEDLQDFLELTPKKDVLFIGDCSGAAMGAAWEPLERSVCAPPDFSLLLVLLPGRLPDLANDREPCQGPALAWCQGLLT